MTRLSGSGVPSAIGDAGGSATLRDSGSRARAPVAEGASIPILAPVEGTSLGVFLGGTLGKDDRGQPVGCLDILDLDGAELRRAAIGFLGHGVSIDPSAPSRAVVFEKRGPGGALVDLQGAVRVTPIPPSAGRHFYGHATYVNDGADLLVVENDLASRNGVVTVRDVRTFAVVAEFPSFGQSPHDCLLLDDGKTLILTNGGGALESREAPSVVFVDVATQSLKEKVTFGDPKINAGHVAVNGKGDFVVCSAPRDGLGDDALGGITLRRGKRKPERMRSPKAVFDALHGESLSACVRGSIAGVTTPRGNMVTFWDLDRQKLVFRLDVDAPRGLALSWDKRHWVVAHGKMPRVSLFDAETFEAYAPEVALPAGCFSGSHVFSWPAARAARS